jgi:arsenite methyltransferase
MEPERAESLKAAVRTAYGQIATADRPTSCCSGTGCCGAVPGLSEAIGYSEEERRSAPLGSDLRLGCGNPQAIAELRAGERVVDLGSGGGFDAFLAARQVGPSGTVIGVDMTGEMVARARANLAKTDLGNLEFRLGEIEHLPIAHESVDVIMSNCVINLSTDKAAVFREAFRVLVPGGRLAISDIVALRDLPAAMRHVEAHVGCVAGAALMSDVKAMLHAAGFTEIRIDLPGERRALASDEASSGRSDDYVASALIRARKPRRPLPGGQT